MADEPTTATILFTDLVGSTGLRVELGEERADRLRHVHDELLTGAVESNNGTVIKGGGDGIMAAFASASDALSAAVSGQQSLNAYSQRDDAIAVLSVRMGLSVGDVSWDDGDCFGTPVVEAARLEAAADGGQILCSDLVRAMARGRGGHTFDDLGFMVLKGLPEPIAACAVVWSPAAPPRRPQLPLPGPLAAAVDDDAVVGRDSHLVAMERFAAADGIHIIWLVGEPGAGKTRLAAEYAKRRHDAGAQVLYGRCDADVRAPYRPFVEAMGQVAHQLPAEDVGELFGPHAAHLVRLLPELGQVVAIDGETEQIDAELGRWRLLESVRGWLVDMRAAAETVLVIDDIHWATESTVQAVRHLVRSGEAPGVTIVATVRDTEIDDGGMAALLADAADGSVGLELVVGGLTRDDVAELAATQHRSLADPDLVGLVESTAGNALFVRTLLRAGDGDLAGSRDVQAVVRRRLGRLPPSAVETLRVAAVVGLEADAQLVASALERPLVDVVGTLDEARTAGLVEAAVGTSYRFVHALVRDALRGDLSPAASALVHLRIAEALDRQPGIPPPVTVRAHHWHAALPAGADPAHVVSVMDSAACDAERQHDWEGGAQILLSAAEVLGGLETGAARHMALRAGVDLRRLAAVDRALEVLAAVADRAWAAGDDDVAATAAIEHSWARLYSTLESAGAFALTTRAREHPPSDPELRLLVDGYHAVNLARLGRGEEARRLWLASIDAARRTGARAALCRMLGYAHHFALTPRAAARDYKMQQEGYEMAVEDGNSLGAAENLISLSMLAVAKGCQEDVLDFVESALADPELRAAPATRYALLAGACTIHAVGGRFERAEALAEEGVRLGEGVVGFDTDGIYGIQLFAIRREQGRIGPLVPVMQRLLAAGAPMWRAGVAAVAAAGGDVDECRSQVAHFVTDGRVRVPDDVARIAALSFLVEAAAVAQAGPAAEVLHHEMSDQAGFHIVMLPVAFGPVNRVLGLASRTAGRLDDAVAELRCAVDESVSAASPVYEARSRIDLAETLVRRGSGDDTTEALAEARRSADIAEPLGMDEVAARAAELRTREGP